MGYVNGQYTTPATYTGPANMALGAANSASSGAGQLMSAASGLQAMYGANAPGALNAANQQSAAGVQAGNALAGSTAGNQAFANQALNTGFNSNNGLYNTEMKNITDQTRTAEAARGISTTPYGAGVESNTLMNFNQQWQQQQLQNQATAAQTAGALENANTSAVTAGEGLANSAAMMPSQALSSVLQAGGVAGQELSAGVSSFLQYLQSVSSPETQSALRPAFGPPGATAFGRPIY